MTIAEKAKNLRKTIEDLSVNLSDEQALRNVELFPHWDGDGHDYSVGNRVSHLARLYKCLIAHTSQVEWDPDLAPSLWVRVDDPQEEWPEWIQPVGSTDAYAIGAKVSHNQKHWISDYDNNTWEPGVFGWTEVT